MEKTNSFIVFFRNIAIILGICIPLITLAYKEGKESNLVETNKRDITTVCRDLKILKNDVAMIKNSDSLYYAKFKVLEKRTKWVTDEIIEQKKNYTILINGQQKTEKTYNEIKGFILEMSNDVAEVKILSKNNREDLVYLREKTDQK